MKRKEFIRIVTGAMEMVERGVYYGFTCNLISCHHNVVRRDFNSESSVRKDYINVFKEHESDDELEVCFGLDSGVEPYTVKQVRLNALAMYLAQSLAFKTYKDL